MQEAKGPDESRSFGGEVGYPRAEIQRTGKNVDIIIAGNGITYPFKTIDEARKTYLLLEMLGNQLCPEEPKETRKCKHCGKEGFVSQDGKTWVCHEHAEILPKQDSQPSLEDMPSFEVESEEQKWVDLILAACRTDQDDAIDPITLAKRIIREKKQHTHSTLESLREVLKYELAFNKLDSEAIDRAIDKEKNGEL